MKRYRRTQYEIWYDNFIPIESSKDNILWETYGEEYQTVVNTAPEFVWTLVDCDGRLYVIPGWHWINRLGYFITQNPHSFEKTKDVKY